MGTSPPRPSNDIVKIYRYYVTASKKTHKNNVIEHFRANNTH